MSDALFREKAPGIMNLLMADFALDVESAAAVLGNLGHESGGFRFLQEKEPLVPGSAGGYGWAQWTGPRRRAYEAYCSKHGYDPASDTANYKWLYIELSGSERAAIPAVKNAIGLDAKVQAFEAAFERAGVKHYESRNEWAQRALAAYRANPGGTINVKDAGLSGAIVISQPADALGGTVAPAGNPIAGVVGFLQGHEAEARKITLTVVGIHNALYPNDQIVVQAAAPQAGQKPISERPSVGLGLLGLLGSLGAMGSGSLGTPFGMGEQPTAAGTLATVVSLGTTILGATGGFGSIAKIALPLLGGLGKVLTSASKK